MKNLIDDCTLYFIFVLSSVILTYFRNFDLSYCFCPTPYKMSFNCFFVKLFYIKNNLFYNLHVPGSSIIPFHFNNCRLHRLHSIN